MAIFLQVLRTEDEGTKVLCSVGTTHPMTPSHLTILQFSATLL